MKISARRTLAILLSAGLLLGFIAEPCWACSCAPSTKKQQAKSADFVFTGVVTTITPQDPANEFSPLIVSFNVETVYKGRIRAQTRVRTNSDEAACGIDFQEGNRYTVFGNKSEGKKWTGLCSGTKRGNIDHKKYGLPKGHPPEE
jgi:hypothetical protein